jgi:dipeptidyl aminopeptidase/acylaminoacyl peptidase
MKRAGWRHGLLAVALGLPLGCHVSSTPPDYATLEDWVRQPAYHRPRWNSQGDLLYVSNETGRPTIHWRDRGGRQGRLSSTQGNAILGSWVPNSSQILVESDPDGSESFQLYLQDTLEGKVLPLTQPSEIARFGSFSKAGLLAFCSNQRHQENFDVYVGEPGGLTHSYPLMGVNQILRFADNDQRLLILRERGSLDQELLELNLASGKVRPLTPKGQECLWVRPRYRQRRYLWVLSNYQQNYLALQRLDCQSGSMVPQVVRNCDIEDWDYHRPSGQLALVTNPDSYSRLEVLDSQGRALPIPQGLPRGVYTQLDFHSDGSLTLEVSGPQQPASIWQLQPGARLCRKLLGQARNEQLPFPEPIRESHPSGYLRGLLTWPKQPKAALIVLHGGPANQARPEYSALLGWLALQGIAIFEVDVRGSTGYGREFQEADDGEKRVGVLEDLTAATEYLRHRGIQRLGLYGHSYGGYLTWLEGSQRPKRWSALVAGAAISDLVSFAKSTAPWRLVNREAEYGREILRNPGHPLNPWTTLPKLQVPCLVYHGRNDSRVDFQQGQSAVEILKKAGQRPGWIPLDGEGHRISGVDTQVVLSKAVAEFLLDRLEGPVP